VSTNNGNALTRHRTLTSSSRTLPTVPRVREDSPSAIVRPSPPSSISNLEILTEEDEDIQYSNPTNHEQPTSLRKQNSYEKTDKYQTVLPTIIESNDYDVISENMIHDESIDDQHNKYLVKCKLEDLNTNSNQIKNLDNERREYLHKNNECFNYK